MGRFGLRTLFDISGNDCQSFQADVRAGCEAWRQAAFLIASAYLSCGWSNNSCLLIFSREHHRQEKSFRKIPSRLFLNWKSNSSIGGVVGGPISLDAGRIISEADSSSLNPRRVPDGLGADGSECFPVPGTARACRLLAFFCGVRPASCVFLLSRSIRGLHGLAVICGSLVVSQLTTQTQGDSLEDPPRHAPCSGLFQA